MKKKLDLKVSKQNFKKDSDPVRFEGKKYWIFRSYGVGRYMISDETHMTLKILRSAGVKGDIPMTKTSDQYAILPVMDIDKGVFTLYYPQLMHLI